MPSFRFLSSVSALASHYSASVLPFPLSSRLRLTVGYLGAPVPLSLSRFSPSFRPGFPCLIPGSMYLASCLFPFVLPCFAPTAVPQVLTFFRLSTSLRCFPLLPLSFVRFRLGSDYSASVSSFPFFPASPHSGSFRCFLSAFPSVCFHTSVPALVLSFPALFLSPLHCFATQVLLQLPASCFQLGRSP